MFLFLSVFYLCFLSAFLSEPNEYRYGLEDQIRFFAPAAPALNRNAVSRLLSFDALHRRDHPPGTATRTLPVHVLAGKTTGSATEYRL